MGTNRSFDELPPEIANSICSLVRQSDVSNLSLFRKSFYQLIRPILFRHPEMDTFNSLVLFSRTISEATYMGKADRNWSNQECLDQTKSLNLIIDPERNNGQPPAAVMISRLLQAIVRRCPRLSITVCFSHCHCGLSPVSALGTEIFPRVTRLVVYVGKHEPNGPHSQTSASTLCQPSARFWQPFVNGDVFPDCLSLEIRHYWATNPPTTASLDLRRQFPAYPDLAGAYSMNGPTYRPAPRRGLAGSRGGRVGSHEPYSPSTEQIGSTYGLKKFETIILECPPELNSYLLMQLLGNPNAVATNLTSLELRFCNLDYETISKLLYHAPPNIKRLVLLCCDSTGYGSMGPSQEIPHLCPLVRDFSKHLVHLEFGASAICRELFFDDSERRALRHNGVETGIGTTGGAIDKGLGKLDGHAIRETIQACRKQKRMSYRNDRVKEAITMAKSKTNVDATSSSIFGGNSSLNANQAATRAQRETEALLDEEEEKRARAIEGSKVPWFRRIITYHGLCSSADTWDEIQVAAEMEEQGVEWVLANKELRLASHHSRGKPTMDINIHEAFREKYRFKPGEIVDPVTSCVESDGESENFEDN